MNTSKIQKGLTIGLDLGDKYSAFHVLDEDGETIEEGKIATTRESIARKFGSMEASVVVIEAGTHSPWVSRELEALGHEVIVANPRRVALISRNTQKRDKVDAELLARLGRSDPKLLAPIKHRGERAQSDLAIIRSRESLMKCRSQLILHVRGMVKSVGQRIPRISPDSFDKRVLDHIPSCLKPAVTGVVETIEYLSERLRELDKTIEHKCQQDYPETDILRQIKGVGPLTSLAFVLVVEDHTRFKKNRSVGAYLGLTPRLDESGENQPQLRITKTGDTLVRKLLVNCAHYIMGPFGEDSELRRWAKQLSERGGKNAKKRAVVALARKLSVLMLALWKNGEVYMPLNQSAP